MENTITGLNTMMAYINSCREDQAKFKTTYWSSMYEYPIMFSLMAIYRPTQVFECGTCNGASALSWAVGMKLSRLDPYVCTFDPARREKIYTGTEWEQYINFFKGPWVGETSKKLMEEAKNERNFVFIDGNHTPEACRNDAIHAIENLGPGDVITFHDAVKHPPIPEAIDEALEITKCIPARRYQIPSSCGIEVLEL